MIGHVIYGRLGETDFKSNSNTLGKTYSIGRYDAVVYDRGFATKVFGKRKWFDSSEKRTEIFLCRYCTRLQ